MSGPGWLQGAMTLGGGSAGASLVAGYVAGYELLWVQPVAMACGVVMLSAIAYQVLSTGERPFDAIRLHIHPSVAWAWALASWISSIVWCFPQFSLAESSVEDIVKVFNPAASYPPLIVSSILLVLGATVAWKYGRGGHVMRLYEMGIKFLVAGIIVCFMLVVLVLVAKGKVGFRDIAGGYSFHYPSDPKAMNVLMAAFATAVGINMTFLFPYTLIARQWGKEHVRLARFDLGFSMLIPYVLATTFIIIASAYAFKVQGTVLEGNPRATDLAEALEPVAGKLVSHIVFDLGILGMTLSTICLLMLVSGFVGIEIFRLKAGGLGHRLAMLSPAVGFLGPVLWDKLKFYMVVPTSVACLFLLPVAYISIFILHNRERFMKEHMPRGIRRWAWNTAMLASIVVVTYTVGVKIYGTLAKAPPPAAQPVSQPPAG